MAKEKSCIPTVFCLAWTDDVKELFHNGDIINSNLEMAGLLMLWLVMEEVCPKVQATYVALSSDNSTTTGWVKRLTKRGLLAAMQLVRALALRLKKVDALPLTPL